MRYFLLILCTCAGLHAWGQSSFQEKIEQLLKEKVPSESGPGLTLGIVQEGELKYQFSRGCMNLEYQLPFNDSTVFALASVSKQFTSACVAVLQKEKKLSLEEDIRKYIPELAFYGDTIRIKHLLNHTSGIRNHNVLLDLAGFDFEHRGYTNASIQSLMFRQKGINNRPGEKMLYSNTNYVLLALLVERVSGKKLHEFAQEKLFAPLGMHHTFYKSNLQAILPNRAYPYYPAGSSIQQPQSLNLCVGAGGMYSTISDMAQWMQVFLKPEHKLSYIAQFVTQLDTLNKGEAMKHARGMFVSPYKDYTTLNHSGRGIGMRSQFICIPELELGVIVFSNFSRINAVEISYQILDLWLPKRSAEKPKEIRYQANVQELSAFTGYYQELNSDLRMHVFLENDTLKALSSLGKVPAQLSSYSPRSFTRIDNPSVKYTFLEDENTEAQLLVDFGGAIFYMERIQLANKPKLNLEEYSGEYYSQELDVVYQLKVENQKLVLNYPNHQGLVLKEGQEDVFGANRRTKYVFARDDKNLVHSFLVSSEGTVKDILFERVK